MNEAQWMDSVCVRLNSALERRYPERKIRASSRKRLPYRFEIRSYTDDKPNPGGATSYQTDLLVFETNSDGSWTPRVVIEGKLSKVSTHDALTYSAKAATHVQVHPYLRYGILVGDLAFVPKRLFRHGSHFDFMITWKGEQPTNGEQDSFETIVREEVEASQSLQRFVEFKATSEKYQVVRRKLLLTGC